MRSLGVLVLVVTLLVAPLQPAAPGPSTTPPDRPSAATGDPAPTVYRVVKGDTIRSVADRFRLDWRDLASWNNLVRPWGLHAGTHLRLTSPDGLVGFRWGVHVARAEQLAGSYRAGCPVPPTGLRILHLYYIGFDGKQHLGGMTVAASQADRVVRVFAKLYNSRFPIERMHRVELYRGSDDASMAANNTSAFNCRPVTGGTSWSAHSYGTAIDLNPARNPYVSGTSVQPPAASAYLDRWPYRTGMVLAGGVVDRAFAAEGWSWGGRWSSPRDYQHFSLTNR